MGLFALLSAFARDSPSWSTKKAVREHNVRSRKRQAKNWLIAAAISLAIDAQVRAFLATNSFIRNRDKGSVTAALYHQTVIV